VISFEDLKGTPIMPTQSNLYMIADEGGSPIIGFKSLLKAEYKSSGTAVSEPIEQNSYATYNKTTEPREFYFEVALQAPNNDFSAAISKLEELKKGTDLFHFVTPFSEFENLTLEGYSITLETYTSMLVVELQCKEIIEVQQGYTKVEVNDATPINVENASNPDNADTVNTGMTGTRSPSSEESSQGDESIASRMGL
jgi:hypothetical protein